MEMLGRILFLSVQVLHDASFWMISSFAVGGLLHEFVSQEFFQKHLGGTDLWSMTKAVLMGMVFPMCSCGVIPLALSFYWSGASLAVTLAFMAATPIINPAAALLALAMFGPELTIIYMIAGYTIPMCLGFLALKFGGKQHIAGYGPEAKKKPKATKELKELTLGGMGGGLGGSLGGGLGGCQCSGQSSGQTGIGGLGAPAAQANTASPAPMGAPVARKPLQELKPLSTLSAPSAPSGKPAPSGNGLGNSLGGGSMASALFDAAPKIEVKPSFWQRLVRALRWGFVDMGGPSSQYVLVGALFAGTLLGLAPQEWIQKSLGEPGILSIGGTVLLGGVMYVCSVGHIPFVAALLAMGASPGVGLTFLIAGVATNAPELVSIHRLISPRAAQIYGAGLVVCSVIVGLVTDAILMPDFTPIFSFDSESTLLQSARVLNISPPDWISYCCMAGIAGLGLWNMRTFRPHWPLWMQSIVKRVKK